jgi:heptosyltransferase-2
MKPTRPEILLIKLGALGDVVRTTPLLRVLGGRVTWVCAEGAAPLLRGLPGLHRVVTIAQARRALDRRYDRVLGFDEDPSACDLAAKADAAGRCGLRWQRGGIGYDAASAPLFDRSLVSRLGRRRADELKRRGRSSYQSLLFRACGLRFQGEAALIPLEPKRISRRVVGLEPRVGERWPSKAWSGWDELAGRLSGAGFDVRVLRQRPRIADYLSDINECGIVVCGDTFALHAALALGKKTVGLFLCTSPAEIHGYGRLWKVVHPRLRDHFYSTRPIPGFADGLTIARVEAAVREAARG